MRRRAGIGAIHKQKQATEKFKDKGNELQENQIEQLTTLMGTFRTNLEEFAAKHKNEIKKSPQFRRQFQEMCAAIGVDPLASGKGFWSVLGMGDFYYELSVQVVEVCMACASQCGGLMELDELRQRLMRTRGAAQKGTISNEDIIMAVKKLKIFGNGFTVYSIGKARYMVQSIPGELSLDETSVLQLASEQKTGSVTANGVAKALNWSTLRAQQALDKILCDGVAWIDNQNEVDGEAVASYWFPSLFPGRVQATI